MAEVLGFARGRSYEPGSNLRGEQADTTWLFLLDDLRLREVAVLGDLPRGTRIALEAQAGCVRADGSIGPETDLLYVAAGSSARLRERAGAVRELLARGGGAYAEPGAAAALLEVSGADFQVDLAPLNAPVGGRPAAPAGLGAWVIPVAPHSRQIPGARWIGRGTRVVRRTLRRPAREPSQGGLLGVSGVRPPGGEPVSGHGILVRRGGDPRELPGYVRDAASSAGVDLGTAGWRIAPPRGYRSQKVVFSVDRGADGPAILKVTQDRRFNGRLANEHAALVALDAAAAAPDVAPRPWFSAEHAGLLVVGQSRLDGAPFRERSDATPDCEVAGAVLDALVDLAVTTAAPRPGAEVAEALLALLEHHRRIHAPEPRRADALAAAFAAVADAGSPVPTVFLHGDVNTHNVLIAERRRAGLVDWENAEPSGLPGWDLTYFVNAYFQWHAALRGPRVTPSVITRALTRDGPWRDLLAEPLRRLRTELELPVEVMPALLLGFWMQLALRESMLLPEGSARGGLYARVLASMLDERGPERLTGVL